MKPFERSDHQPRANEQHESDHNLPGGEGAHRAMVMTAARGRAAAFTQCAVQVRPHDAPHGHDADEESGSKREGDREDQHGQIESDAMESRSLGRRDRAQRENAPCGDE